MADLSQMTDDELLAMYQQLKAGGGKPRAMPGGVVNSLNEQIEAAGTGSAVNARMEPYRQDLDGGHLDLGPVRNLVMEAQNWAGQSSPQSRRYATFRGDLEKMRNDSLRLNKGTQTEGDAVRAWNELFTNLHDEKLVAERLAQIQSYNDEAVRLRKGVVDSTREQYGLGGYDWAKVDVPRDQYAKPGSAPHRPVTLTEANRATIPEGGYFRAGDGKVYRQQKGAGYSGPGKKTGGPVRQRAATPGVFKGRYGTVEEID